MQSTVKTKEQLLQDYGSKEYEIDGTIYHQTSFYSAFTFFQAIQEYFDAGFRVKMNTNQDFPMVTAMGQFHLTMYKGELPVEKTVIDTNTIVEEVPVVIPTAFLEKEKEAEDFLTAQRDSKDPSEKEALAIKRGRPSKK